MGFRRKPPSNGNAGKIHNCGLTLILINSNYRVISDKPVQCHVVGDTRHNLSNRIHHVDVKTAAKISAFAFRIRRWG